MRNHVSAANDVSGQLFTMHQHFGPPGVPPVPPPIFDPMGMAMDMSAYMYWPPGFSLCQNKLTVKVWHRGLPIVQDGHDCGVGLIHIQAVPGVANALTALHILFSSRRTNFCTSKLVAEGRCVASAGVASIPTPMTACAEPVSLPTSVDVTCGLNSWTFEITPIDIIIGFGNIAMSMLIEFAVFKRFGAAGPASYTDVFTTSMARKFLPITEGKQVEWIAKAALATTVGACRVVLTDAPVHVNTSVGSPYFKVSHWLSADGEGEISTKYEHRSAFETVSIDVAAGDVSLRNETRTFNTSTTETYRWGQKTETKTSAISNEMHSWGEPL